MKLELQTTLQTLPAPGLKVELPEPVLKRSFALKSSTLKTLESYARFLSMHHDQKVDEGAVLESLILGLRRDRYFRSWQKEASDES